jgi:membrane protease YdiL (CAAX protease family)
MDLNRDIELFSRVELSWPSAAISLALVAPHTSMWLGICFELARKASNGTSSFDMQYALVLFGILLVLAVVMLVRRFKFWKVLELRQRGLLVGTTLGLIPPAVGLPIAWMSL